MRHICPKCSIIFEGEPPCCPNCHQVFDWPSKRVDFSMSSVGTFLDETYTPTKQSLKRQNCKQLPNNLNCENESQAPASNIQNAVACSNNN